MTTDEKEGRREISSTAMLKFLCFSGFGIFMFMFPLPGAAGFSTAVSELTGYLDKILQDNVPWLLLVLMAVAFGGALLTKFYVPEVIKHHVWLQKSFCVSGVDILTKLIGLLVTGGVVFGIGPEAVIGDEVGGGMVAMGKTLIAIAIALSFILPFLTECGSMEFIGVLLRPLIRPLFHVPGRASVDLIASWLASSNTAVLITAGQYKNGYYSKREAATIMTNFSLVSIPFCLVVAQTLQVVHLFPILYMLVTVIGFFLAVIGVRLWPLRSIPNTYVQAERINEVVPENCSLLDWALQEALKKTADFRLKQALEDGAKMAVSIIMDLIPLVIAWGTVGTLLVSHTPLFYWLSYPMGVYLELLGVADAFKIAPATLVGFVDMFVPALITDLNAAEETRFIVAALSLVQIIYMTEVGSIIVSSGVGLDIKRLFIIFLQRTVIATPIVVTAAKWLCG